MAKELGSVPMENGMKVNGKTACGMDKALPCFPMVIDLKATNKMAVSMESALTFGLMVTAMWEALRSTECMVTASTSIATAEAMRANGQRE